MPVADTKLDAAIDAATRLRREIGCPAEGPLPCVLTLAEDHLGLDVVVAKLPWKVSGAYLPTDRGGVVFVNGAHAVVRQRFTIAHEAGHHVLGHGAAPRVLPLAETPALTTGTHDEAAGAEDPQAETAGSSAVLDPSPTPARPRRSTDPRERAANTFAAELLAPAPGVRAFVADHGQDGRPPEIDLDFVVRLSCAYGISAASVLARLETAEVLRDSEHRAALQVRIDAGDHVPRYRALGLEALVDELQRVADSALLPRVPEGTDGALLAALFEPAGTPVTPDDAPGVATLRGLMGVDG